MKVLVTGAGGLVGKALTDHCRYLKDIVFSYQHQDLDIADAPAVRQVILDKLPDVVINCAAWTNVDACEFDEARAFAVNAAGPANLANACREAGSIFVTISTDYVFDGTKHGFYTQSDEPNPESVYAASKLEGERRAAFTYDRSIIVRTGYVFGRNGSNFLSTVVERAKRGGDLKAISDTYGTPTYAKDLAERLRQLAQVNFPGLYHVVNNGPGVSFEQFTRKAIALVGNPEASVEAVSEKALNRPAKRPANSRLRCLLTGKVGLAPLRDWENALEEFVRSY